MQLGEGGVEPRPVTYPHHVRVRHVLNLLLRREAANGGLKRFLARSHIVVEGGFGCIQEGAARQKVV